MKVSAVLCLSFVTLILVDRSEIIGKWRFSKIDTGDGNVLDLEAMGGVGAEWSFIDDGSVFNHAESKRGRWSLHDKILTVQFGDDAEAKPKRWTIKSINDQEMLLQRKLADGKTSTEHVKRLENE